MRILGYNVNLKKEELSVSYVSLCTNVQHDFLIQGTLSLDGKTFFANSKSIDTCDALSQTEKEGIKKFIMKDSQAYKKIGIVFQN